MQKQQPRFSEDQRRELGAVHSWVRKGQLPRALDVTVREIWEARKRLGWKILSSRSRDRGLTSDISVFGSLILKEANSINVLLSYILLLNHITSQIFYRTSYHPIVGSQQSTLNKTFICVYECLVYAYMYIHHMCTWCPLRSEEGTLELQLDS